MSIIWNELIVNLDDVTENERLKLIDIVYELCDRLFLYLSEYGRAVSVPEQFYVEGGVPAHVQIPLKYVEGALYGSNPLRISANSRIDPVLCGGLTCVPYVESIVLDIDSDDMLKSIDAACRFARWLEREFGVVSQVLYTGRNACLRIFVKHRLGTDQYEKLWSNLTALLLLYADRIGVPRTVTVDPRSSNVAVHVRVPYTVNEKSRTFVRVIDYSARPLDFKDIDVIWNSYNTIKQILDLRLNIDVKQLVADRQRALDRAKQEKKRQAEEKKDRDNRQVSAVLPRTLFDIDLDVHPPCIRSIIEELFSGGHPSHNARFALASYMLRLCVEVLGRKIDECIQEIEEFFKHAGDYRPEKTRYQLSHIGGLVGKKTFYMSPNCDTMREWGLCPYSTNVCGVNNPLTYIARKLRKLAKKDITLRTKIRIRDVEEEDYGGIT